MDFFDEVNIIDIGFYKFPAGIGGSCSGLPELGGFVETVENPPGDRLADLFGEFVCGADFQGPVGEFHSGVDLTGRLEAAVGSTFALAVDTDQGLQKPDLGEFSGFLACFGDLERPVKSGLDFVLCFGGNPF